MIYTLHQTFFSRDQTEKNKMGGACSAYGKRRDGSGGLVRKPEGKEATWKT